jgi:glycosyltransferase involved in cell wall biosynthesis
VVRRGGRLGVYREARRFWNAQPPGRFDVVIDEINTRPFLTPRWIGGTPVAARSTSSRAIWSYETPFPVSALGRYLLEPWWLRSYRRVPALTVSESSAQSLRAHHGWTDVTVVPEGWTPHEVPNIPKEDAPTVVFLGRLVGMKRPEHAIRGFEVLRGAFASARMWVIGDGPLLQSLRRDAVPSVTFLGRVGAEELRTRLARSHVLVSASVREGWGPNVSEAAACGTPSIAYAVPGLVDSVAASGGTRRADPGNARRYARSLLPARPPAGAEDLAAALDSRCGGLEARLVAVVDAFRSKGEPQQLTARSRASAPATGRGPSTSRLRVRLRRPA